jgi:hypothetical protein
MRIMRGNCHLVNKPGAQPLDGSPRGVIVRVARDGDRIIDRRHEWCEGATSAKRVTVTAMHFQDLESNVSRADTDVLRIADAEVDMPYIHAIRGHDAEMIIGHKTT